MSMTIRAQSCTRTHRPASALVAAVVSACTAALLAGASVALAAADEPPPVRAQSTAQDRREVAVTAYNNNLALVREVRQIEALPRGEFDLHFLDVPALINPRTVSLRSAGPSGGGVSVLEQNYEYDLTSPERLMDKYLGKEMDLIETTEGLQDRVTRATLLSTTGGHVFRIGDKIAVGHPGRVVLPSLPEGLFNRPTLVWKLSNEGPSSQRVEAAYLTDGISWSADYVAVADPETTRLDLTGWVTLENRSGASYQNALLKLVAGDVQRVTKAFEATLVTARAEAARAPSFEEQPFFEYHLYTLDRRTDIRENQTKQLRLLEARSVPVRKRLLLTGQSYQFRSRLGSMAQSQPVSVTVEMRNAKESGLGIPLPAGVIRMYQQDRDGAQQFAGEDRINHTPRDETVTLRLGSAFDVVADRVQTDWKKINVLPYDAESAFEIRLRNHKDSPVSVTVRESLPQSEWKVLEQSPEGRKIDALTLEFEVPVPANGEAVVRYRVALKM